MPRLVVLEWLGDLYLLDAPFDEDLDDYQDFFTIYRLPLTAKNVVADNWAELPRLGEVVGQIPVHEVEFDPTRRKAVRDDLFRVLGLD